MTAPRSLSDEIQASAAVNAAASPVPPLGLPPEAAVADAGGPSASTAVPAVGPSARALMIRGYLEMGADHIAKRTQFDGWSLSTQEALQIATDLDDVLKKYFPQLGDGEMPPEFRLLLSVGGAIGFRYYLFSRWKQEQEDKAAEAKRKADEEAIRTRSPGAGAGGTPPAGVSAGNPLG